MYPSMKQSLQLGFIPGLVAEALKADWDGTLSRLAEAGYCGIELSAGLLQNSGLSAEDALKILERHGFTPVSCFAGWEPFDRRPAETISLARQLGVPYLVWGWAPVNDPAKMEEALPVMVRAAAAVEEAGMTLLYHNHDHEFRCSWGDQIGYDWLLGQFPHGRLQMELDAGWVAKAGHDPCAVMARHPGRCPIVHLRDLSSLQPEGDWVEVGQGVLDLPAILKTARDPGGARWAIVEHTKPLALDPVEGLILAARNLQRTGYFPA